MAEHKILLVLGRLNRAIPRSDTVRNAEQALAASAHQRGARFAGNSYELEKYTCMRPQGTIITEGRVANEAPLKLLMRLIWDSGDEVSEVLYLASADTQQQRGFYPSAATGRMKEQTAETYLRDIVRTTCRRAGHPAPQLVPIPYAADAPAPAVQGAVHRLRIGDVVHIDTTGGGRDAVAMLILIVQLLEYKDIRLGHVVYSRYEKHSLELQDDLYHMRELIKAVESFNSTGQGEKLAAYFAHTASPDIAALCAHVRDFSHMLALCRVEGLDEGIRLIHDDLDTVYGMEPRRLTDPNELLLQSLIPTVKANFVRLRDPAHMILDIISWCLDRGMLQQAIGIYRERVPEVLYELKLVRYTPAMGRLLHADKDGCAAAMAELLNCLNRGTHLLGRHAGEYAGRNMAHELCLCRPLEYADPAEVEIYIDNTWMSQILTYQFYLRQMRNAIMHADHKELPEHRGILTLYGLDYDSTNLTFDRLRTQMRRAVAIIRLADRSKHAAPVPLGPGSVPPGDLAGQAAGVITARYERRRARQREAMARVQLPAVKLNNAQRLCGWGDLDLAKTECLARMMAVQLRAQGPTAFGALMTDLDRTFLDPVPHAAQIGLRDDMLEPGAPGPAPVRLRLERLLLLLYPGQFSTVRDPAGGFLITCTGKRAALPADSGEDDLQMKQAADSASRQLMQQVTDEVELDRAQRDEERRGLEQDTYTEQEHYRALWLEQQQRSQRNARRRDRRAQLRAQESAADDAPAQSAAENAPESALESTAENTSESTPECASVPAPTVSAGTGAGQAPAGLAAAAPAAAEKAADGADGLAAAAAPRPTLWQRLHRLFGLR